MILIGVDYSITSPAICIYDTKKNDFRFSNCLVYYVSEKPTVQTQNVIGYRYPKWSEPIERFLKLAMLLSFEADEYAMEDYSFASKGKTFTIGENGGVFKTIIYQKYQKFVSLYAPSAIKKFATKKGNANKENMWEAFCEESDDLKDFFKLKGKSPLSDIVDSYFVLKMLIFDSL